MGPNVILAEVVAAVITDGHIQIRDSGKKLKYGYVGFFSEDKKQLLWFQRKAKKLSDIKPQIRKWGQRKNGRSLGCIIYSPHFAKLLIGHGVPYGNKVSRQFSFPRWIKKADNK